MFISYRKTLILIDWLQPSAHNLSAVEFIRSCPAKELRIWLDFARRQRVNKYLTERRMRPLEDVL